MPDEPRGAPREDPASRGPALHPQGEPAVLLFLGGPLDGRVEVREARHGAPLPTVTHTHLHDGPKVVHHYDLHPLAAGAGVYHLRVEHAVDAAESA